MRHLALALLLAAACNFQSTSCLGFATTLQRATQPISLLPANSHYRRRNFPFVPSFSSSSLSTSSLLRSAAEPTEQEVFDALMRDFQIEGTPLLECDASGVETFMGATFSTLAELSSNGEGAKACLVLANIPISAISAFADDFVTLKLQPRLMKFLPEVERVSVEVLKHRGYDFPVLVMETGARTEEEEAESESRRAFESVTDESQTDASIRSFVRRIVVDERACPFTTDVDVAPSGLDKRGVPTAPVGYRHYTGSDAFGAIASFWTAVCELKGASEDQLSTIVLSMPAIGPGTDKAAFFRFAAVVEWVGRVLCLYRGDSLFGLVHFHPAYDRDAIVPKDAPAYGHLPPHAWLRSMMRLNGNVHEADSMTDEQLRLSDYQRRSPHTAINILRNSQISAAAGANSIVDLELEDGSIVKASGITTYSRNAISLEKLGQEALDKGLEEEINTTWGI